MEEDYIYIYTNASCWTRNLLVRTKWHKGAHFGLVSTPSLVGSSDENSGQVDHLTSPTSTKLVIPNLFQRAPRSGRLADAALIEFCIDAQDPRVDIYPQ